MNVSTDELDLSSHFFVAIQARVNHGVPSPPPRNTPSHHHLPPLQGSRPQSLLRLLQIMGSAGTTPLFHSHPTSTADPSMDGGLSRSLQLSHSLHVQSRLPTSIPPSEIFSFVCSFPLLEGIPLATPGDNITGREWSVPSTSPKFTGTLNLKFVLDTRSVVRCLE